MKEFFGSDVVHFDDAIAAAKETTTGNFQRAHLAEEDIRLLVLVFWKRCSSRFRFHQKMVVLLVAIPPTNLEAVDTADRFRFQNPGWYH